MPNSRIPLETETRSESFALTIEPQRKPANMSRVPPLTGSASNFQGRFETRCTRCQSETTAIMAALLRRLPGATGSPGRCPAAIIRGKQDNSRALILRGRGPLQAADGRPVAARCRTQSRRLHTGAAAAPEVDLKRRDGEDQGRNTNAKRFPMDAHRNERTVTPTTIINENVPQM